MVFVHGENTIIFVIVEKTIKWYHKTMTKMVSIRADPFFSHEFSNILLEGVGV
jgi:hypothetical protein